MKNAFILTFLILTASTGFCQNMLPRPRLYYDFNEKSGKYISKGTEEEIMHVGGQRQRPGKSSSGVSGLPDDRAWDATENTACGVGTPRNESRIASKTNMPCLDKISKFTMTFWFTSEQFMGDAVRLVYKCDNLSSQKKGFMIRSYTTEYLNGKLALWIRFGEGRKTFAVASEYYEPGKGFNTYGPENKWMFVAVTWNGEYVTFYYGDKEEPVKVSGYPTRFPGKIAAYEGPLILGNADPSIRGLDGKIDNFRFYDTALDMDALEKIRQADIRGN